MPGPASSPMAAIRERARRDLHLRMRVPAIFRQAAPVNGALAPPVRIDVRVHRFEPQVDGDRSIGDVRVMLQSPVLIVSADDAEITAFTPGSVFRVREFSDPDKDALYKVKAAARDGLMHRITTVRDRSDLAALDAFPWPPEDIA